eukprot:6191002-Pleurochrysis_carterae.AAC.2
MLTGLRKQLLFVTNNAAQSRSAYAERFARLGLDVRPEQIVPSSFAAARWLRAAAPTLTHAFVIGEEGLRDELRAVGITPLSAPATPFSHAEFRRMRVDERVGAVVVGHDTRF